LHLSKKHQIPYVVNENWSGYTEEDGNYNNPIQKYFTKKIIAGTKKIMPTSTYLQEAMLAHGLSGNYEVVPNVVDVNRFKPLNGPPSQKIKFIHISSLIEKEKNVSGILRAFKMALSFNPNLELVIVGEGENKINLQKLALELNIANDVIFKGRLTGDELVKNIDECNALLMFSHYETFCLVNIEAFACGKPVITSNAGAIPSYMNEQLGLMVEKNDEKKLSEAILKFAKNPSIYNVDYIRAFAQNFSYEKVGKQLDDIYNKTLFKLL
jgi:L-malate glycosyltransferase